MRLIQYNPTVLTRSPYSAMPGVRVFSKLNDCFSGGLVFLDRTGTVRTPVKMMSLFPIPAMKPMRKSFEDICNTRAQELLKRADDMEIPIRVFWSGGIDSTLALVSLLKHASDEQKKNIIVLMSEMSISENPNFYENHVRGKLRTDSVMMYPYLLGGRSIFVSGEQNDQIFGADMVRKFLNMYGTAKAHDPYARDGLFSFFNAATNNAAVTNGFLDMFERIIQAAPIQIRTYFEYFWWLNFTTKWQNTFMRSLTCVAERNVHLITPAYIRTNYEPFYNNEDFQLWSMNNLDKRIKDEWKTYKWICKDIIYDYTKDAEYRDNKTKHGSLRAVIIQQNTFNFIDDGFKFYNELDPGAFLEPNNDFTPLDAASS